MPEKTKKRKPSQADLFIPFLVLIVSVLAFAVGVLWNKVNTLSSNTGAASPNKVAAPQNAGQPVAGNSKLTDLVSVAQAVGIESGAFQTCVDSKEMESVVENQYQSGLKAGVEGTPGNFIVNAEGRVWALNGLADYNTMKSIVEGALGEGEMPAENNSFQELTQDQIADLQLPDENDHIKGNLAAPVTIIEYSDLECPFCQRFHPTLQRVYEEYGGRVSWIYRHFPLDALHPNARPAAEASECVAKIGGNESFWNFIDEIFSQ